MKKQGGPATILLPIRVSKLIRTPKYIMFHGGTAPKATGMLGVRPPCYIDIDPT